MTTTYVDRVPRQGAKMSAPADPLRSARLTVRACSRSQGTSRVPSSTELVRSDQEKEADMFASIGLILLSLGVAFTPLLTGRLAGSDFALILPVGVLLGALAGFLYSRKGGLSSWILIVLLLVPMFIAGRTVAAPSVVTYVFGYFAGTAIGLRILGNGIIRRIPESRP